MRRWRSDHVLDLVAAAQVHAALAQRLRRAVLAAALAAALARTAALAGFLARLGIGLVLAFLVVVRTLEHFHATFVMVVVVILVAILLGAQRGFLGGVLGLFAEQRFAILLGDLVIVGMDFAEGQEAVAIAAIVDERRLERRFDACHLGQIDIALELLALGGLEIKLLDSASLDDRHAGFLPVACVDQHTHGHLLFSGRAGPSPLDWCCGGLAQARDMQSGPGRRIRRLRSRGFRKLLLLEGHARTGGPPTPPPTRGRPSGPVGASVAEIASCERQPELSRQDVAAGKGRRKGRPGVA